MADEHDLSGILLWYSSEGLKFSYITSKTSPGTPKNKS